MKLSPQFAAQLPLLKVIASKTLATEPLRKRLLSTGSLTTLKVLIHLIRLLATGQLDIPTRVHQSLKRTHRLFIRRVAERREPLELTKKFVLRNFSKIHVRREH